MFSAYKILLAILCCILTVGRCAAQLVNEEQVILLTQGSVLVTGDISNNGQITNQGEIYVSGDWKNAGNFYEETGAVHLVGTSNQRIWHRGQSFYQLYTSGAVKILEDSLNITNQLILTNALIKTQPTSTLLMRKTATINGASMDAYIEGALYWEGIKERFYPIGQNGFYAPLWLSEETETLETDPYVGINLYSFTTGPRPDTSLSRVSIQRGWERTVLRGVSKKAYATLSILGDEELPDLDSVVVAGTDDLTTFFHSLGKKEVSGSLADGSVKSDGYANVRWLAVAVGSNPTTEIIYIPNAFAPASINHDEKVFKIYGVNLSSEGMLLTIYNRWGNVVFNSHSFEQITKYGWDGINQDSRNEEVQGVYTYTLRGKFKTGKSFQKKGTITLIR